jgi:hypothetical protein
MKGVLDNPHCMKHACSHPLDEDCPYCKLDRAMRVMVKRVFDETDALTDQELLEMSL